MDKKLKSHILNVKLNRKTYLLDVNLDNIDQIGNITDFIAGELSKTPMIIELHSVKIPDELFLKTGQQIKQLCEMFNSTMVIKNRADIAFLTSADCLILNDYGINIESARKIVGNNTLIGHEILTAKDITDLNTEIKYGVDYIVINNTQPTPAESTLSRRLEYAKRIRENTSFSVLIKENPTKNKYFNITRNKLTMLLADKLNSPLS